MVIGLRAFPDGFAYVILDGTQKEPNVVQKDRLSLPSVVRLTLLYIWLSSPRCFRPMHSR